MKALTDRAHGYLDYGTVLFLALAPTMFGLFGNAAAVFYVLAIAHLTLTLATAFPLGLVRWLRFSAHGAVEAVVAFALAIMPWVLGYSDDPVARNVSVATAIGIGIVAFLTDYRHVEKPIYERALEEERRRHPASSAMIEIQPVVVDTGFVRQPHPLVSSDFAIASFPPSAPASSIPVSSRLASPTPVPVSEEGPASGIGVTEPNRVGQSPSELSSAPKS
jgi:hypothetical protein